MRFIGLISIALLSTVVSSAPAFGQVMARGFYNHVEDRISFFIPAVTSPDQITIEEVLALTTRGGNGGAPPHRSYCKAALLCFHEWHHLLGDGD